MKELLFENEIIRFEFENGIIIGTFKLESVDINLAKEVTTHRLQIQKGKSFPLLSNIKSIKSSTKQARDYMASEEGCQGVVAAAVLIDSPLGSMIGNFFISISRPYVTTKIFTDDSDAKKWLAQFVK
ncbi:MAG: hypothetical protein WAQ28_17015 [Bacteroidia bacterium]